jgi:hypothetical protein
MDTLPPNTSIVPGAAISIVNSQIDTHQQIVLAVELPAHVTISENELRDGPGEAMLQVHQLTQICTTTNWLSATFCSLHVDPNHKARASQ